MRKLMMMVMLALGTAAITPAIAQEHKGKMDMRARQEKIAEKLHFTDDQNAKMKALNEKYSGDNMDRKKYREEFQSILTEDQKKQIAQMKADRQAKKKAGGAK